VPRMLREQLLLPSGIPLHNQPAKERERLCVVCERETQRKCACVYERESARERKSERKGVRVGVGVNVRVRVSVWEGERVKRATALLSCTPPRRQHVCV